MLITHAHVTTFYQIIGPTVSTQLDCFLKYSLVCDRLDCNGDKKALKEIFRKGVSGDCIK